MIEIKNIGRVMNENPFNIELSLGYYGYHERLPRGHMFGNMLTTDYLLQYCTRGCGEFVIDSVVYPLKEGEFIVTYPGQMRVEKADMVNPWGLMWIGIDGKSAEYFVSKLNVSKKNPVIKNLANTEIPILLKRVIDVADTVGFERDFLLAKRLFDFFDKFTEIAGLTKDESSCMADNYVAQAMYFLEMHYSKKDITISSLADGIGLNRSYLYEIFKERTGLSPQEYLTKLRIRKAIEFMELPKATVTSVANSVGYEPSVFSKAFKKAAGITPKEYMESKESRQDMSF